MKYLKIVAWLNRRSGYHAGVIFTTLAILMLLSFLVVPTASADDIVKLNLKETYLGFTKYLQSEGPYAQVGIYDNFALAKTQIKVTFTFCQVVNVYFDNQTYLDEMAFGGGGHPASTTFGVGAWVRYGYARIGINHECNHAHENNFPLVLENSSNWTGVEIRLYFQSVALGKQQ